MKRTAELGRRRWLAGAVLVLFVGSAAHPAVAANEDTPGVEIAAGAVGSFPWALEIGGKGERRCYHASISGSVTLFSSRCMSDGPPRDDWTRVLGAAMSSDGDYGSIELNVTTSRVRELRLRVHVRGEGARWIHTETESISAREARRARVQRNFRFAVIEAKERSCTSRVIAFDQAGTQLLNRSVPCEG